MILKFVASEKQSNLPSVPNKNNSFSTIIHETSQKHHQTQTVMSVLTTGMCLLETYVFEKYAFERPTIFIALL